jgi:hypothetical protein
MLRIYFDGNPLVESGWPRVSARVESLANLARLLRAALVVPEPVELELEAHWKRDLQSSVETFRRATAKLRRALPTPITLSDPLSGVPMGEELLHAYHRQVEDWIAKVKAVRCAFVEAGLREFSDAAVDRHPPFSQEGRGFQDAVIHRSVVEDLRRNPGDWGILVTRDSDFDSDELQEQEKALGINLEICRMDRLSQRMEQLLTEGEREAIRREEKGLEEALRKWMPAIEAFVKENLELSGEQLGVRGILIAIPEATVTDIDSVAAGRKEVAPDGSEQVEISFHAILQVLATTRTFLEPPPAKVRVRPSPPPGPFGIHLTSPPQDQTERITTRVEVEGVGRKRGGNFIDFQFGSVRLSS